MTIMNAVGFDASAIGDYEFDAGAGGFEDFLRPEGGGYPGPLFPYLSASLDFSNFDLADLFTDELLPSDAFGFDGENSEFKLARSTIVEADGHEIGVVRAISPSVASITSLGDVEVIDSGKSDAEALAALLQAEIEGLVAEGINKIVLSTHLQQLANEEGLVVDLIDVDVILAGAGLSRRRR